MSKEQAYNGTDKTRRGRLRHHLTPLIDRNQLHDEPEGPSECAEEPDGSQVEPPCDNGVLLDRDAGFEHDEEHPDAHVGHLEDYHPELEAEPGVEDYPADCTFMSAGGLGSRFVLV